MEQDEESGEAVETSSKFFLLLIAGIIIVFVGIAVILITTVFSSGGSTSAGVIIFIGPFPIVIGAGPDVTWIVLFSIILAVLSVVVFLIMNKRVRRFSG
jgi:uncharacterized membrane protein